MKTEIKPDKRNYRIHNDRNKELIKKSLEECGSGRSILLDKNGEIIAGNGVFEQAERLGIPVKIIESDGKTLVAVKRTDLDTEDEKRKQLAVMDNATNDTSIFDIELMKEDFDVEQLGDFGITALADDIDWATVDDIDEDTYKEPDKKKLQCPHCNHIDSAERFRKVGEE